MSSDNHGGASRWVRRLLPVVVLLLGAGVTVLLLKLRKPPRRQEQRATGVLVEVLAVKPENRRALVRSQGTVQPAEQVAISPQVPGRVIWVHPSLVVGGRVRAGESLIKLEPVDYRLVLERARAEAVQAEKNLIETESNAAVAQREWRIMGEQTGEREANPLALYEPQLKLARAQAQSATAQIEQARVNLARTVIRAPFNLRVRSESVERGQYVTVGQTLATVYGTDRAEVLVPLPVDDLRWIELPGEPGRSASPVTVQLVVGTQRFAREGTLLRTVGEIDADGRMAKVVVGLADPYGLRRTSSAASAPSRCSARSGCFVPEFQIGAFVDVMIQGRELGQVYPIPASALRLGSVVWVAGPQDRLHVRKVEVARMTEDEALISSGLSPGDHVILTTISGAVEGMSLRLKKAASDPAGAQASTR